MNRFRNGFNFNRGSSSATAPDRPARALRTALYALLLAAGLPFAAQAQTCVPGATADWMVTGDQLAAPIRPAECASVEQSPPDFGWPDLSSDGVYQVTLTYPDGRAKTLAATQNWINWDEVLPAGTYSWQVQLTDSSGTRISRARQFTVSANATPFLVPDAATLLSRVTAAAHPRGLPDPTTLALMLGDRQSAVSALAIAVNSQLSSALPGAPIGSVESQVREECMRTLNSLTAYLYTKQDIYFDDAARRVLNLASWDPRGSTSYANAAQASRFLAWTVALGYDWLSPRMPNGHKNQVLSMMRIRVGDMYNDLIGPRARIAKYPRDSQGNQTLVMLAVISTLLAGDLSEANTWLQSSLPLAINATNPWGTEEGGFANADAFGTSDVGELLVPWYTLRWSAGVDLSHKAWVRNWSRFIAYFLPPGTPSGVFGDGAEQALGEPWARFGKGYTHFAPTSLGRWYASQLTGEDPLRMEYLLSPLADLASNVFPDGTPNSAVFLSLGQAAMHSGLADPARTSVYFKSSPAPYGSFDHSHADQNSFVVNAGGQRLAIDSGYYDGYKTPHWWQWYKQTRAHNAVTFDGGKGQLFFEQDGKMGYGAISNYGLNPDHDIVHGDATQAYGGALREAKRSMVYLRPNMVLVYDRLASDIPRQWEWNIHALNLMNVVSDRQISIENNGQRLCVNMLAGPTMRFTQSDLFTAAPIGTLPLQWHGNFYSVDLLGAAEFIALLNVGCTETTASASNTGGVWTVLVGSKIVTISDIGISVAADTQAPSVPTGLVGTAVSSTQINLTWNASTDNVGVTGYYVYVNDVALGATTATSFQHTGLTAGTTYNYHVSAFDAVPNHSALTATAVVTTPPVPDTQAPSIPANLAVTGASASQVNLSWSAATDNVGVSGYYVSRNGVQIANVSTTSYSDAGLVAATTYSYAIAAYDAAGNGSAQSAAVSATTQAAPNTEALTAPANVTVTAFSTLDPYLGDALNWEPLTPSRWSVVADGGDLRYGVNTTDFVELPTARLGEYSLVKGRTYGNFLFSAHVRSTEDFAANPGADYAVVFGWQDADNYYYAMFNRAAANTLLFKVVGGVRQPALATANVAIPDNNYHLVAVARNGSLITVSFDGAPIMQASDATFGAGRIGIGGYNDAAWWDDIAITGAATTVFSTLDPYLGDALNWEPLTPSRWSVVADGGDLRYGINTTDFVELPTARLGEYSLVKGRTYGNFLFSAHVRSTEDFAANPGADYAVVFGWQDADNYYYAMFNRAAANTLLFKVVGGVRQPALATANVAIPDNNYHLVAVARNGSLITVSFDGAPIMQASDATFGAGRIGIGGYNDAAWWDDIAITGAATTVFSTLDPYLGDALNWEPLTPSRWSVVADGGDLRYGINTTDFVELPTARLGEYSLVKDRTYGDFAFAARVRSSEDFAANPSADYAVVFGWQDADNYYYAMFNRAAANTLLFKVVGGVRQPALATANFAIPDNLYHLVQVARNGSSITVSFDAAPIMQATDATFGAGRIGVGGFNDAAWWDDIAITGPATADTQPPTVPADVTVTALSSSQITLAWNAATDNVGVTGYRVYNGTLIASPTGTSVSITGLSASTPYAFTVAALDAAGNASAQSAPLSVTTPAPSDTTAPSTPTGLTASALTPTSLTLSWSAATDNVGVTGYRVYNGTLVASPTGTSVSITGLSANTPYAFTVAALDAAGNASAQSAPLSVTTPTPPDGTVDCANPAGGYEGFGRNTTGGASKPVYRVTNLNDSGAGSLRDAISVGNRCVVFDVGGNITLASLLSVKGANVTIDGFTAPSPGITLRNHALEISGSRGANNVVVRGLRSRDANLTSYHGNEDGFTLVGASNVVIDHVSVKGFGDGAIDITDDTHDVTVQWSIFGEGNPAHNFLNLIGYGASRISVHHNLFINGDDRSPYVGWNAPLPVTLDVIADVRNNLMWNYGWVATAVRGNGTANVVNNYYHSALTSDPGKALYIIEGGVAYANGNYSPSGINIDAKGNRATPFAAVVPTTTDAVTAANQVVAQAGTRGSNFGLDTVDQNYIGQILLVSPPAPPPATTIFSALDSYLGDALNWEPLTPSRWSVASDGGDLRYGINTTAFTDLPTARLGEYSLVKDRTYGDFAFAARVRSSEDFAANPSADYAVVFGWQDADNYYYAMFNRAAANTLLFKVVGGVRQPALATANVAIPDNNYHLVAVARTGSLITVSFDGAPIMQATDATFGAGRIGVGGYNDAAWWDDIVIAGPV
jgi:chitodextrinase